MRYEGGRMLALFLATAAILSAQSARSSYGPGRVWWDAGSGDLLPWQEDYENPDGQVSVLNAHGAVRTARHAFFEPLGSNGRACVTCHQPSNAMSVSTASVRERWIETKGSDPIFAAVDGSNCPDLPQSARASHSLLLERGLFRIFLPWPPKDANPEFQIEVVSDPTGCNTSAIYGLKSANPRISVYRRPRVAANFKHVIAGPEGVRFMSDAREPSLQSQATTAAMVHEQAGAPPSDAQLRQIVEFESQIYTAQSTHIRGGRLNERGSTVALGPEILAEGAAGAGSGGLELVSFDAWRKPARAGDLGMQREFRASVARGRELFFARRFRIGPGDEASCASCHAAGMTRWMDIGTTNRPTAKESDELPLFRITCDPSAKPHPTLGHVIYTHDPGRALISGKCADVGSIVMQQFHGLAARAPYFSNGSAKTLREAIDFYDRRFEIGYRESEKQDLENFLSVL